MRFTGFVLMFFVERKFLCVCEERFSSKFQCFLIWKSTRTPENREWSTLDHGSTKYSGEKLPSVNYSRYKFNISCSLVETADGQTYLKKDIRSKEFSKMSPHPLLINSNWSFFLIWIRFQIVFQNQNHRYFVIVYVYNRAY